MRRRTAVRRTAAVGLLAIAGCMHNGQDQVTPSPGGTATDAPPSISGDPSFTVHDGSNGDDEETATVVFDPAKPAVTVEGIIVGKNGCQTAALGDVAYDANSDTLGVEVVTKRAADAGDVCTEALKPISYTAGIEFDGGLPGTVEVVHESRGSQRTVATESR